MLRRLTGEQQSSYSAFSQFTEKNVTPFAGLWDRQQGVPRDIISLCSEMGYVGGIFPKEYGGGGWDAVTFGLLNETMGAASPSLCGLLTVQTMVGMILAKWGSDFQKSHYLEPMTQGKLLASFAMTEPKVGSDIQAVETIFSPLNNGDSLFLLNGTKKWITYSAIADLFLVFGKSPEGKSMAGIIESDTPGVTVTPLKEMLGFRGAHLSQIEFKNCRVKRKNIVGKPGLVLNYVAPYGLHYGRLSTAWSSVGILRSCVETSASYASNRNQFNQPIKNHGMIQQMIVDMGVDLEAAQHLCLNASKAEDNHSPKAIEKTLIAKYYASRAAVRASSDTIQIMGAAGCYEENSAARYYRDAKITEIIEGTNQIQQKILGNNFCKKHSKIAPNIHYS